MPFIVSEQIEESDYDPLFAIQYTAFVDEPVLLALYPGGLDPSVRAQNIAIFKTGLGFGDPNVAAAKAVDAQTGEICAFATMRMYDQNPFFPAKDSDVHLPWVAEDEKAYVEWIFNAKSDRRRNFEELQKPGSYGCMFQPT